MSACGDSSDPGGDDEVGSTAGTDSGTSDDGECTVGSEGCPCTVGGACDAGLTCLSMVCVDAGGDTGDTTSTTTDTGDTTTGTDSTDTTTTTTGSTDTSTDTDTTGTTTGGLLNCGDGNIDINDGEQCDDGNMADGDGCSANCQVEVGAACGDGVLNPDNAEECDDGNVADGDGCSANCQLELLGASCGDGMIDNLEICDDDNTLNGDACNPTCNLENTTTLFAGGPGIPGLIDGTGANARFGGWLVATSDNDALWVGDSLNNGHAVVRRVDATTGAVLTIAGGNQGYADDPNGLNAQFQWVEAITTDGNTIWVADEGNHRIRAIDPSPPYAVTTVAGDGQNAVVDGVGQNASFGGVRGITYYDGLVYVLDGSNAVLRSFNPQNGEVQTIAGQVGQQGQQDGFGNQARFISPRYMASDNSGMLFIADTNGNKIRTYNVLDTYVGTFAGDGTSGYIDDVGAAARIHRPRGMSSDGTSIYFSEFNQHTVRQGVIATASITTNIGQHCNGGNPCNGGYQEGTGTANTQLTSPVGLTFHYASNTLFVCDSGNNVIRAMK